MAPAQDGKQLANLRPARRRRCRQACREPMYLSNRAVPKARARRRRDPATARIRDVRMATAERDTEGRSVLRRPDRTIVTGDARAVLRAPDRHPDRVPAARGGDAVDPLEHVERAVEGSRVRASASAHHSPAGPPDRFADGGTPRRQLLMRAFGTNAERLEKPGFHPVTANDLPLGFTRAQPGHLNAGLDRRGVRARMERGETLDRRHGDLRGSRTKRTQYVAQGVTRTRTHTAIINDVCRTRLLESWQTRGPRDASDSERKNMETPFVQGHLPP